MPLSPEEVRTIAIKEVEKREGWLGTAGEVSREGRRYYVFVAQGNRNVPSRSTARPAP